jgi:hypothetical protein
MTRVSRWCTLAGITAALLSLAGMASAATGWTVLTPSGLTAGTYNYLNGSFARTDTDAWAVGESTTSTTEVPLALHWNGTAWSSVPTPAPSGSATDWLFEGVAASSASDAWAVGEQVAGTKIHDSLYEHWNGTAWSVVSGPNEGIIQAVLDFSDTNAYAFADFSVLHWNGTAWSVVSGAVPALRVSADGPDDIWGVSRDDMVTHFNGTTWSSTTLPAGTPDLQSVAALSPTDVWVSGANTTGTTSAVLEHFNGTSWQEITIPSSFSDDGLNAVTAKSDSDVWVFSNTGTPGDPMLLANWNGSSWTTSTSPIPAGTELSIGSASSSPSDVWLVGTVLSSTLGEQPLILNHS